MTIEYISNAEATYKHINMKYHYIFYDEALYVDDKLKRASIPIKAGEDLKTWDGVANIIKLFQELKMNRHHCILVVGGGTIQDAFGFACSIYNRGILWDYLPTTLGAMCDSCIGGKTSINFNGCKNIIGTFSDPETIYIDTSWLKTSSKSSILSGLGEMNHIFAVAQRYDLMKKVEEVYREERSWSTLIKQCQDIKTSFIEKDKFDKNERLLLNYGHTFGHALEANFPIPHGVAVAWGAMLANKLSYDLGMMSRDMTKYLNNRFNWIISDAEITSINTNWSKIEDKFFDSLLGDKKNTELSVGCILMEEGKAVLKYVSFKDIKARINNIYANCW